MSRDRVPSWKHKQRLLWGTLALAYIDVAALMGSVMFWRGWEMPAAFLFGFFGSLLLAHLANEISANDPPPSLEEAMARFQASDDL